MIIIENFRIISYFVGKEFEIIANIEYFTGIRVCFVLLHNILENLVLLDQLQTNERRS